MNLVVTLRKFVSLLLSVIYFDNDFTAFHWLGTFLVFTGTLLFTDVLTTLCYSSHQSAYDNRGGAVVTCSSIGAQQASLPVAETLLTHPDVSVDTRGNSISLPTSRLTDNILRRRTDQNSAAADGDVSRYNECSIISCDRLLDQLHVVTGSDSPDKTLAFDSKTVLAHRNSLNAAAAYSALPSTACDGDVCDGAGHFKSS